MPDIKIEYVDGTTEVFPETSRSGGSYCTSGKAEDGWYTVTDAYGAATAIPAERIKKVTIASYRHY